MTERWANEQGEFVDWIRPDGGALSSVRLKPSIFDDDAVARFYAALAEQDCRVANGAWFGEDARVFRLGFGYLSIPELEGALGSLSTALTQSAPSVS